MKLPFISAKLRICVRLSCSAFARRIGQSPLVSACLSMQDSEEDNVFTLACFVIASLPPLYLFGEHGQAGPFCFPVLRHPDVLKTMLLLALSHGGYPLWVSSAFDGLQGKARKPRHSDFVAALLLPRRSCRCCFSSVLFKLPCRC